MTKPPKAAAKAREAQKLGHKVKFQDAVLQVMETEEGRLVMETLVAASQVWAERPAEGQSLDNFMGRRDMGLFLLKHMRGV